MGFGVWGLGLGLPPIPPPSTPASARWQASGASTPLLTRSSGHAPCGFEACLLQPQHVNSDSEPIGSFARQGVLQSWLKLQYSGCSKRVSFRKLMCKYRVLVLPQGANEEFSPPDSPRQIPVVAVRHTVRSLRCSPFARARVPAPMEGCCPGGWVLSIAGKSGLREYEHGLHLKHVVDAVRHRLPSLNSRTSKSLQISQDTRLAPA